MNDQSRLNEIDDVLTKTNVFCLTIRPSNHGSESPSSLHIQYSAVNNYVNAATQAARKQKAMLRGYLYCSLRLHIVRPIYNIYVPTTKKEIKKKVYSSKMMDRKRDDQRKTQTMAMLQVISRNLSISSFSSNAMDLIMDTISTLPNAK